ncbi:MAG: DUF2652 domain-containing protein [Cytophagales bacterium]|nr:DUF2652 domain-containing protein [Cytophagales bacterium]
MPKSLLFIPDITGFTEFVNNTEIEHGQHIISELLEKIIDSNEIGLEVSEIEGDAVLFYKVDHKSGLKEVYNQARKIFLNFHSHLKLYESQRICQCGACSSASKLSLKFVVHSADIGFTTVKNHKKPFGSDIVLLHRLLKNNISYEEYILFTDQYLQENQNELEELTALKFENGTDEYENIGLVNYSFVSLADLYSEVPEPPPVVLPEKMRDPIAEEYVFDLSPPEAYEYLSNFDLKIQWSKGVTEFKYDKGKVNRIGTKHICVFEKGSAEFESVTNDFGKGKLVYGEKLKKFPLATDFTIYFILSAIDDKTKIRVEIHYKPLPVIGWLLKPIILMNAKKINQIFINSFSKLKRSNNIELSEVTS